MLRVYDLYEIGLRQRSILQNMKISDAFSMNTWETASMKSMTIFGHFQNIQDADAVDRRPFPEVISQVVREEPNMMHNLWPDN